MTYGDKTWCWAKCKADGSCGRKLTELDRKIIREFKFLILYADLSPNCELYEPDTDGGEDAIKT